MGNVKKITITIEEDEVTREFQTTVPPHDVRQEWKNDLVRTGYDGVLLETLSRGSWLEFQFYMPNDSDGTPGYTYFVKQNKENNSVSDIYVDRVPAYPVKRLTRNNVAEIAQFIGSNSWTVCQGGYGEPFGVVFHEPHNGQKDITVLDGFFVVLKNGYTDKYKIKVYDPEKFHEKFEKKVVR